MKLSEQFYSLQGEGLYSGVPSWFLRYFTCSLQCQGFGQKDPTNPATWVQPWKDVNIDNIKRIEDLPKEIYEFGCDSVYSWAGKFKGIQKELTPAELLALGIERRASMLDDIATGKTHIVFTGGEPLMPINQRYIAEFLTYLVEQGIQYPMLTFETNGTQRLKPELIEALTAIKPRETLISCSPKLLHTSGEKPERALKPEIVRTYRHLCLNVKMQGKYVVANSDAAKEEFLYVQNNLYAGIFDFVYLMPEGPNRYRVNDSATDIAEFAMQHGFRFTHRLHNLLWDNKIGV